MKIDELTLITVIGNLLLQPILQYLLNSRCSHVDCLCVSCDREVLNKTNEQENDV